MMRLSTILLFEYFEVCNLHRVGYIAIQFRHNSYFDLLEMLFILLRDWLGRLLRDFQWVDRGISLPQTKVEVRACRVARATHIADNLTLRYSCANIYTLGKTFQVEITRREVARVFDFKNVAIRFFACFNGLSITGDFLCLIFFFLFQSFSVILLKDGIGI